MLAALLRMTRLALLALAMTVAACGEPPGPSPEQIALFEQDVDVELVVPAVRNAMRYEVGRIEAPAGATVRLGDGQLGDLESGDDPQRGHPRGRDGGSPGRGGSST